MKNVLHTFKCCSKFPFLSSMLINVCCPWLPPFSSKYTISINPLHFVLLRSASRNINASWLFIRCRFPPGINRNLFVPRIIMYKLLLRLTVATRVFLRSQGNFLSPFAIFWAHSLSSYGNDRLDWLSCTSNVTKPFFKGSLYYSSRTKPGVDPADSLRLAGAPRLCNSDDVSIRDPHCEGVLSEKTGHIRFTRIFFVPY